MPLISILSVIRYGRKVRSSGNGWKLFDSGFQFVEVGSAAADGEAQERPNATQIKEWMIPGDAGLVPHHRKAGGVEQMIEPQLIKFMKMLVVPEKMRPVRSGEKNAGLGVHIAMQTVKKMEGIHQVLDHLKAKDIGIIAFLSAPLTVKIP